MIKGENGVWAGTTTRAVKPGALALQLHRRRRDDGRFAQRQRLAEPDAGAEHALRARATSPRRATFRTARSRPCGTSPRRSANAPREMVVYTPPGYEKGTASYPVLYLIHGGGDTAVSWSTVGRANNILDNLLAEKKARPMIVVMPSGWTPSGGQVMTSDATKDPFNDEMMKDIIPFVAGATIARWRRRRTARSQGCRWAASRR